MDYPFPWIKLSADGTLDLSEAYASGIGEWDKVAISYGYAQFAPGTDTTTGLDNILDAARACGLTFLTDIDARPLGSSHPQVHLWDSGVNAVDELQRLLGVRAAALARLGENSIQPHRPLATIEEALVPIYLLHRYQLEAAAKSIGGTSYTYALRGDGQVPLTPVAPAEQRRALTVLLGALTPAVLSLPEPLLRIIPPRPEGFPRHRELFTNHTAGNFDALAPAEAAADLTFVAIFEPGRAARLIEQSARDPQQPSLREVLETTVTATWRQPAGNNYAGEIQRTVDFVMLERLFGLAADPGATQQTKAVARAVLADLRIWLHDQIGGRSGSSQAAHYQYGEARIAQFLEHPQEFVPAPHAVPPPGSPIGMECEN